MSVSLIERDGKWSEEGLEVELGARIDGKMPNEESPVGHFYRLEMCNLSACRTVAGPDETIYLTRSEYADLRRYAEALRNRRISSPPIGPRF